MKHGFLHVMITDKPNLSVVLTLAFNVAFSLLALSYMVEIVSQLMAQHWQLTTRTAGSYLFLVGFSVMFGYLVWQLRLQVYDLRYTSWYVITLGLASYPALLGLIIFALKLSKKVVDR